MGSSRPSNTGWRSRCSTKCDKHTNVLFFFFSFLFCRMSFSASHSLAPSPHPAPTPLASSSSVTCCPELDLSVTFSPAPKTDHTLQKPHPPTQGLQEGETQLKPTRRGQAGERRTTKVTSRFIRFILEEELKTNSRNRIFCVNGVTDECWLTAGTNPTKNETKQNHS